MNIIDAHLHIETDIHNTSEELDIHGIKKGLVYLIDETMPKERPDNIILGTTVKSLGDVKKALKGNIKIIKFLPYEHKLFNTPQFYDNYKRIFKFIEKNRMVLSICSTYGSKWLYDTNGVKLAFGIKNRYPKIPIILAHGGGPRVLDAMSLMMEYDDVYMDLSFSLFFWKGSTVIQDYVFALNKLGYKRTFFGSDVPYVSFEGAFDSLADFVNKGNINFINVQDICYNNFVDFERKHL